MRLSTVAPESRGPARHVPGLSVVFGGKPLGEAAELIVDLLS